MTKWPLNDIKELRPRLISSLAKSSGVWDIVRPKAGRHRNSPAPVVHNFKRHTLLQGSVQRQEPIHATPSVYVSHTIDISRITLGSSHTSSRIPGHRVTTIRFTGSPTYPQRLIGKSVWLSSAKSNEQLTPEN